MLANWSTEKPTLRFPKILYTMFVPYFNSSIYLQDLHELNLLSLFFNLSSPTGSNPTGCSSPLSRKIAILAIARKYNLLIFEDDAYHYIHFDPKEQAPSYFELEARDGGNVGRVVRFDSFSKILSSG